MGWNANESTPAQNFPGQHQIGCELWFQCRCQQMALSNLECSSLWGCVTEAALQCWELPLPHPRTSGGQERPVGTAGDMWHDGLMLDWESTETCSQCSELVAVKRAEMLFVY